MTLSDCGADARLELGEGPFLNLRAGEERRADLFGGIPSRATNDDVIALFVPFKNRPRRKP